VTVVGNLLGAAVERRRAAAIIAVSAATATGNGLQVTDRTVHVIANFLAPNATSASTDEVVAYTALLPVGVFILFVGDLRPMKGIDVLLDAYTGLDSPPPLVLIGKSWPDTPTTWPPGVVVYDRWPNAAVIAAWQASAIGVVPSVWAEPFGIVVIEAMAGGCAVIASACGGIPEIVEDGVSGVLVPPGDPDRLRQALSELVADPARRAALGAAARSRAEEFTAASVVPRIVDVYRLVRSARSPSTS
jgi:glycosyltransferase involved in cell wall biosynthesis